MRPQGREQGSFCRHKFESNMTIETLGLDINDSKNH